MTDILKIDSTIKAIENNFQKEIMEKYGSTPTNDKLEIKITLHGHELYYGRYKWNGKSLLIQEFRGGQCDLDEIL
jgi:hypothetical protein